MIFLCKFILRTVVVLVGLPILLLILSCLITEKTIYRNIQFNQFGIQENQFRYLTANFEDVKDTVASRVYAVSNYLRSGVPSSPEPKNILSTFEYVLKSMSPYSTIYPSETYFYYTFRVENEVYSGNLRFCDADRGIVHIGYFKKTDPHGEVFYKPLTAKDGVDVKVISENKYEVCYKDACRVVKQYQIPKAAYQDSKITENEIIVSNIFDEAGIKFILVFNSNLNILYYVLDEESGFTDNLDTISGDFFYAKRTSYIFYQDKVNMRRILVGVQRGNVFWNNHFDGPFDQVPPRLQIRDILYKSYPYTKYRGGLDEHGNFTYESGQRVAISPYYDYSDFDDFFEFANTCLKNTDYQERISCLTYETKRDFHKLLEKSGNPNAPIYYTLGWPANHYYYRSIEWPASHVRGQSLKVPANHIF